MGDIQLKYRVYPKISKALVALTAVLFAVFVWIGTRIFVSEGSVYNIISPFEKDLSTGIYSLCVTDFIILLVITLLSSGGWLLVFADAIIVFAYKGLCIGAAVSLCAENSCDRLFVGIIASYIAVTLLTALYLIFISDGGRRGVLFKTVSFLTAGGTAAVIRILPYLFL